MVLKRIVVLIALMATLGASAAWAQEREPLVMRVEFEWSIAGIVAGAAVGALVWLTDPANPNSSLADDVAGGAAWGAVLGAGFGIYVLQRSAIVPATTAAQDALAPQNRISPDPVAALSGESFLMAQRTAVGPIGPGLRVPLFRLRF